MRADEQIPWALLLLLRLSVFLVMFMRTMDKFLNPAHTAQVMIFVPSSSSSYAVGVRPLSACIP